MTEQKQLTVLPWDAHNQKLVSNVHPADRKNPTPAKRYNLVVIGGGTAGLVSAVGAAGLGAKVALIEKHFLGDTGRDSNEIPTTTSFWFGWQAFYPKTLLWKP